MSANPTQPPKCIHCQSTDIHFSGATWTSTIGGKFSKQITTVTFQRCTCNKCKRRYNYPIKKEIKEAAKQT